MVNYYDVLKVSKSASGADIKSAYRRLARKLHPDRNNGSEATAVKFAAIAEAYEVLGNSRDRASYDRRTLEQQYSSNNGDVDSIFTSKNAHAKRWRQMVYEKRYNDIIDRMIQEERREAMAFERAIYPAVALTASTFLVVFSKLSLFPGGVGLIVLIVLFAIGVFHIIGRYRESMERLTFKDDTVHESILDESDVVDSKYTRLGASLLFTGAVATSFLLGFLASYLVDLSLFAPNTFSPEFYPYFFLYPPIVVLFVDLAHKFASGFDS